MADTIKKAAGLAASFTTIECNYNTSRVRLNHAYEVAKND